MVISGIIVAVSPDQPVDPGALILARMWFRDALLHWDIHRSRPEQAHTEPLIRAIELSVARGLRCLEYGRKEAHDGPA